MKAAKSLRLKLTKKKSGFLIRGDDRPGAIAEITQKLAQAKIKSLRCRRFAPAPVATAGCFG
jgi:hypothetical protein